MATELNHADCGVPTCGGCTECDAAYIAANPGKSAQDLWNLDAYFGKITGPHWVDEIDVFDALGG